MGVKDLAITLAKIAEKPKQHGVKAGRILSGNSVDVGGQALPYSVAVDMPVGAGDWVFVLLNDTRTRAVIVGR